MVRCSQTIFTNRFPAKAISSLALVMTNIFYNSMDITIKNSMTIPAPILKTQTSFEPVWLVGANLKNTAVGNAQRIPKIVGNQ